MNISDISKYENKTVSVVFTRRPYKSMSNSVSWSQDQVDFPIYRGKIAKRVTDDKTEWLLCNNFIGDSRLRVLTGFEIRGGYNHAMELTPTALINIKEIKENRNV